MLEVLGRNSRRSLAASEVVKGDREEDTRCATTLRKIITGHNDFGLGTNTNNKSLAASAASAPTSRAAANPNSNVNRAKVLYNFMIKNHKF